MAQSSQFCLKQQAMHQARADTATLVNVRTVALTAATAWGREATLAAAAERRRAGGAIDPADAAIDAEFRAEEARH